LIPALTCCVIAGCSGGGDDAKSGGSSAATTAEQKAEAPARTTASSPRPRKVPAPAGIARPRTIEVTGRDGQKAVEKALGREVVPGQPTVIGASCRRGACVVRYRSQARGGGMVLSSQTSILHRLFARSDVRSVTLYVHHALVGNPEKNEAPAFAVTTCSRARHPRFDWAHLSGGDIRKVCDYVHQAGGKLRSEVRRGLKSNKEASRGDDATRKP
jgi:hypothetical protein